MKYLAISANIPVYNIYMSTKDNMIVELFQFPFEGVRRIVIRKFKALSSVNWQEIEEQNSTVGQFCLGKLQLLEFLNTY